MNRFKSIVLCCIAFTLITGCASISNFQTGKPLGKGNIQGTFGVSNISTMDEKNVLLPEIIEEPPKFTFVELQAALGITDKFDVGLKYTFPTSGFLDAKYCLVGAGKERGFFFSPGLKAGYTSFPTTDTTDDSQNDRIELFVPLYLSLYMTEFLSLSVIPSYSGRFFTSGSYYNNLLGGNVNVRIGKKIGFIAEASLFHNFRMEWNEFQVGGALYLQLKNLF